MHYARELRRRTLAVFLALSLFALSSGGLAPELLAQALRTAPAPAPIEGAPLPAGPHGWVLPGALDNPGADPLLGLQVRPLFSAAGAPEAAAPGAPEALLRPRPEAAAPGAPEALLRDALAPARPALRDAALLRRALAPVQLRKELDAALKAPAEAGRAGMDAAFRRLTGERVAASGASVEAAPVRDELQAGLSSAASPARVRLAPGSVAPSSAARWSRTLPPQAPTLRLSGGDFASIGLERDIAVLEPLTGTERAEPRLLDDAELGGPAVVASARLGHGVRQMGWYGDSMLWTSEGGDLHLHSQDSGRTQVLRSELGPVDRFAVGAGGQLFAVGSGFLQRWELEERRAWVLLDDRIPAERVTSLDVDPLGTLVARFDGGTAHWTPQGELSVSRGDGKHPTLEPVGPGLYADRTLDGRRLWGSEPARGLLRDLGTLPVEEPLLAAARLGQTVFAAVADGVLEWDLAERRYRRHSVEGLAEAAAGAPLSLSAHAGSGRVLVAGGSKAWVLDPAASDDPLRLQDGLPEDPAALLLRDALASYEEAGSASPWRAALSSLAAAAGLEPGLDLLRGYDRLAAKVSEGKAWLLAAVTELRRGASDRAAGFEPAGTRAEGALTSRGPRTVPFIRRAM